MIDLSLGRVQRLLDKLGNPEKKLPPVVHVAGTNGKGSTVAFLRAFLEAAGYRVHVYTSPHLVHFNERIRLAGRLITDDELTAILEECEAANGKDSITFFEITTAAAFLAFSREPADVVLLETGLGGRLDATNVLEKPLLTVLTPISADHQAFLGDTVEEIAREKAGILKKRVPCVSASLGRQARSTVKHWAEELDAKLVEEGEDWFVTKTPDGFTYHEGNFTRSLPRPGLEGPYQVRNAGLAIACIEQLHDFDVPAAAIELGLRTANWPARMQRLDGGALAERLPEGWELWLDGGHNPAAAKMLANQARSWRRMPLHMVVAMMKPRSVMPFLKPFVGRVGHLIAVPVPDATEGHDPEAIAHAARQIGIAAEAAPDLGSALTALGRDGGKPARVLVCGSLYLAGAALEASGEAYLPA